MAVMTLLMMIIDTYRHVIFLPNDGSDVISDDDHQHGNDGGRGSVDTRLVQPVDHRAI